MINNNFKTDLEECLVPLLFLIYFEFGPYYIHKSNKMRWFTSATLNLIVNNE